MKHYNSDDETRSKNYSTNLESQENNFLFNPNGQSDYGKFGKIGQVLDKFRIYDLKYSTLDIIFLV